MENNDSTNTLSEKLISYTISMNSTIKDVEIDLRNAHGRIDVLEANYAHQKVETSENRAALTRVENRLEKAEGQREKFSDYMGNEVRTLQKTVTKLSDIVDTLSENDDKRHEVIINHLSELSNHVAQLAETTSKNADYISETEAKERQEKYAKDKVDEALAPRKRIKEKVIMTAVGAITLFTLGVLGKLAWMAINLDELVNQAKVVKEVSR